MEKPFRPSLLVRKGDLEKIKMRNVFSDVREVERKIFPSGRDVFLEIFFENREAYKFFEEFLKRKHVRAYNMDVSPKHRVLASLGEDIKPMSLNSGNSLEVNPLPMRRLFISVFRDPKGHVRGFSYKYRGEKDSVYGEEELVLRELQRVVQKSDPDIIISNLEFGEWVKLAARLDRFSVGGLGRRGFMVDGRIFLHSSVYLRLGLAGLEERSIFTYLPPMDSAGLSYGRMVEERQTFMLLKEGYAVPPRANTKVVVRTALEIHLYDKGGFIITPRPGLYRNVACLDFTSMFPHIIVRYGVSYETATRRGIKRVPAPFLAKVVDEPLAVLST